jgi:hypothetical protein
MDEEHTPRSGGAAHPGLAAAHGRDYVRDMEPSHITMSVYTPFADLDLLLAEEEQDAPVVPAVSVGDIREPDTVDAFNAQILAGLVSP